MTKLKTLTTEDLQRLQAQKLDLVLVDVLASEHFDKAHIPGSLNAPVDDDGFLDRMSDLVGGDKSREVVVYCANESCDASTRAARKLREAGYENVADYEGGLQAWKEAGEPVETHSAAR